MSKKTPKKPPAKAVAKTPANVAVMDSNTIKAQLLDMPITDVPF